MIEGLAREGLSDEQIALKMGIGTSTYYRWQEEHREFREALKKGKAPVDIQVENALLKRALGYTSTETIEELTTTGQKDQNGRDIIKEKHVRKVTREIPPDVGAIVFWLKNRKPKQWRDKIEALPESQTNDLLASLLDLERRTIHD